MKKLNLPSQASPTLILLAVLALGALWLSGMPFFFEETRLLSGSGGSAPYRVATWGNTLIAASAALYAANLCLSVGAAGRWATRLAGAGAAVLVTDIGADLPGLRRGQTIVSHSPVLDYYDAISVTVPMVVICYLVVERVNQERSAGAFVMWTILLFIGLEMWLLAPGAGSRSSALISGFHDYWGQAYLLAHVIGYGAFAVAAGTGILLLARHHLDTRGIRQPLVARWLPDAWSARTAMLSAIAVGVPVFALALFLALLWALGTDTREIFPWLNGLWAAGVLAFYGAFLHLLVTRIMPGPRVAWSSVLGLGLTLAASLAIHVLSQDIAATFSGLRPGTAAAPPPAVSKPDPRSAPERQVRRLRLAGPEGGGDDGYARAGSKVASRLRSSQ
jgi:ABC-type transport system involved in cytochrome c biogenesis permease subunit